MRLKRTPVSFLKRASAPAVARPLIALAPEPGVGEMSGYPFVSLPTALIIVMLPLFPLLAIVSIP